MLQLVDALIRQHLVNEIAGLTANEVGFEPPNDAWRQRLGLGDRTLVNVYLADLRENRTLRRASPRRDVAGREVFETAPPLRVDCHYLLSAWSPAASGQPVEPTLEEHALLGEVIAAFAEAEPFSFARVFAIPGVPAAVPAAIAEDALPFVLLPVEGFDRLSDFWGTMGETAPSRPVVYLVVTVPFLRTTRAAGGIVTTLSADYRATGALAGERLHTVGGFVGDGAAPLPDGTPAAVPDAFVELLTATGRRLAMRRTGPDGRFVFDRLPGGSYEIRSTHSDLGIRTLQVMIPSATGSYDLVY